MGNMNMTCSMGLDMQHRNELAPPTCKSSINIDMQLGLEPAAWTETCSMDTYMKHEHSDIQQDMDGRHRHGHAAWAGTLSMDMDFQHGQ